MQKLNRQNLIGLFISQCREADLWVSVWDRDHTIHNAASALNALGKVFGVFNVLSAEYIDEILPETVTDLYEKYKKKCDEIARHDFHYPF